MTKTLKKLLFAIFCFTLFSVQANSQDGDSIVDIRQQAMQAIWERLDRLSTLIARPGDIIATSDGSSIVIGNNEETSTAETYALVQGREALQDASEIVKEEINSKLTDRVKLFSDKINLVLNFVQHLNDKSKNPGIPDPS